MFEPISDGAGVPKPTVLTPDAALKIIDPKGIGKTVNEVFHEHELSGVYHALRFVATTDRIPNTEKGVWSTQITGIESLSELEFSQELLGTVVKENRARFDSTEWSRIAEAHRKQNAETQRRKLFNKGIADGHLIDPYAHNLMAEDLKNVKAQSEDLRKDHTAEMEKMEDRMDERFAKLIHEIGNEDYKKLEARLEENERFAKLMHEIGAENYKKLEARLRRRKRPREPKRTSSNRRLLGLPRWESFFLHSMHGGTPSLTDKVCKIQIPRSCFVASIGATSLMIFLLNLNRIFFFY